MVAGSSRRHETDGEICGGEDEAASPLVGGREIDGLFNCCSNIGW